MKEVKKGLVFVIDHRGLSERADRCYILTPGAVVSHFKREFCSEEEKRNNMYLYEIVGIADHTETGERLMVYRAMYGEKGLYCRPYEMFMEKVDKEKYPHSTRKYRFEIVTLP